MARIAIYPFPYSSRNNKYVSLLYSHLTQVTNDFKYEILNCENKFTKLLKLSRNSGKFDKNIIHIHWINSVYGSKYLAKSIFLLILNFGILFYLKKIKKFKIFWTKHNYSSHDFYYPFIDKIGRKLMLVSADKVIIQQESEHEKMNRNKKFLFIPHGHYIGAYGPIGERNKLRDRFKIKNDDILLISLGIVKPYKKLENIMRSFGKSNNLRLKLLVVGQCSGEYGKLLEKEAGRNNRVIFDFNFIEDKDISDYLAAADFSVFWYDDSVLTSGGIILSLSYGVPVLARNLPASELIKDNENGFIYNTESELISIFNNLKPLQSDGQKVISSVESLNWEFVAKRLADEFAKI